MKNAILLLFLILNGFTFSNEIIMTKELGYPGILNPNLYRKRKITD